MQSKLCEQLGIEFPLFAFSHCRDVVAEVSNAGGFGVLGAVGHSPETLDIELTWIDEHVGGKPYGVDLLVPTSMDSKEAGLTAADLEARIPPEHKQYVENLLARHNIDVDDKTLLETYAGIEAKLEAGDYMRYTELLRSVMEERV